MLIGCASTAVAAELLHSSNRIMQSSCRKMVSYVYTGEISANALAAPCSACAAVSKPELGTVTLHDRHCTVCTMCSAAHARFHCREPAASQSAWDAPQSMQAALASHRRPVLQVPRKVPQVLQRRCELAKQNQHQRALPCRTLAQGTECDEMPSSALPASEACSTLQTCRTPQQELGACMKAFAASAVSEIQPYTYGLWASTTAACIHMVSLSLAQHFMARGSLCS